MAQKLPTTLEFTHVVTSSYTVDDELITIDFLVNSTNGTAGIRGISNQPEFKMLYVGVNGDVYIFSEDESKQQTAIKMPTTFGTPGLPGQPEIQSENSDEDELMDNLAYQFKKTGKTKTIAGISASEYKASAEGSEITYYAGKAPFDFSKFYTLPIFNFISVPMNLSTGKVLTKNEIILEMEVKSTEGPAFLFKVDKVLAQKTSFPTSTYKVLDMNNIEEMMKELQKN